MNNIVEDYIQNNPFKNIKFDPKAALQMFTPQKVLAAKEKYNKFGDEPDTGTARTAKDEIQYRPSTGQVVKLDGKKRGVDTEVNAVHDEDQIWGDQLDPEYGFRTPMKDNPSLNLIASVNAELNKREKGPGKNINKLRGVIGDQTVQFTKQQNDQIRQQFTPYLQQKQRDSELSRSLQEQFENNYSMPNLKYGKLSMHLPGFAGKDANGIKNTWTGLMDPNDPDRSLSIEDYLKKHPVSFSALDAVLQKENPYMYDKDGNLIDSVPQEPSYIFNQLLAGVPADKRPTVEKQLGIERGDLTHFGKSNTPYYPRMFAPLNNKLSDMVVKVPDKITIQPPVFNSDTSYYDDYNYNEEPHAYRMPWQPNFYSMLLGGAMGLGQLIGSRQRINNPDFYVSNPNARRASAALASIRYDMSPIKAAINDNQRQLAYNVNNAGGMTGSQRQLNRIAAALGMNKYISNLYQTANEYNDKAKAQWANAIGTFGQQDREAAQKARIAAYSEYQNAHNARTAMTDQALKNIKNVADMYAYNEFARHGYNSTLNLYDRQNRYTLAELFAKYPDRRKELNNIIYRRNA